MKVSALPSDPGPAAWNELLPPAPLRESLNSTQQADWLVIGAGFTGLTAARRLAELHPNDRIVVLDAKRVADGPAGRNSGFMIDVPHVLTASDYSGDINNDHREIRLNRAGIAYATEIKQHYGMSDEALSLTGKINGAITQRGVDHNLVYAKYLDSLAEPYEILDAAAMHAVTGIECYQQGLYTAGTAMLQPAMYIRALAEGIESDKLRIYENSPVITLDRNGELWQAQTPDGLLSAPRVILSVNGHLESFGFYKRQLVHVYTYGSMTRALTLNETEALGGQPRWALTPADTLGTTVRRISGVGGDRIIVRNRATFDPSLHVDEKRLNKIALDHDRSFQYRFPQIATVDMEYRWGGKLCLSRNNVNVFGEIDKNLFAACCQNGLGTAKGTISGKLIAELACQMPSSLLEDQLAGDAPNKLPPEPFASIGATGLLRWGEFRAGKEL